jgi:hypothetical protein
VYPPYEGIVDRSLPLNRSDVSDPVLSLWPRRVVVFGFTGVALLLHNTGAMTAEYSVST